MEKSKSIKRLSAAIAVFHSKMKPILKDTDNVEHQSRYASLGAILTAIAKPMKAAGLVITQFPVGEDGLSTILAHTVSGEFIQSEFTMKMQKDVPQETGARISYMRRFSLAAVLGLNIVDNPTHGAAATEQVMVAEEGAEWLDEHNYHKYMSRIKNGERGVFSEACRKWKISDAARAELKKAQDSQPKIRTAPAVVKNNANA